MLLGTASYRRAALRVAALTLACSAALPAADPVVPLTVCEVARDLAAQEGKDIAIIGRYSFRTTGRFIAEQSCDPASPVQPQLALVEDSREAPRPPGNFEMDALAVKRKLAEIQKRTQLGKFRFGTPDYDRWAVIFGRVQPAGDGKKSPTLLFRGDGVIFFIRTD